MKRLLFFLFFVSTLNLIAMEDHIGNHSLLPINGSDVNRYEMHPEDNQFYHFTITLDPQYLVHLTAFAISTGAVQYGISQVPNCNTYATWGCTLMQMGKYVFGAGTAWYIAKVFRT